MKLKEIKHKSEQLSPTGGEVWAWRRGGAQLGGRGGSLMVEKLVEWEINGL